MKNIVLFICIQLFILNFTVAQKLPIITSKKSKQKAVANKVMTSKQIQFFIIKSEQSGYGYDIYRDGNLYIHQTTIPSIGGNKGFADTTSAAKIARFIIKKMIKTDALPTISKEEVTMLIKEIVDSNIQ